MCHVAAGIHNSMTALFETAVHVHCLLACVASKAFGVKCSFTHLFIKNASFSRIRYAQSEWFHLQGPVLAVSSPTSAYVDAYSLRL